MRRRRSPQFFPVSLRRTGGIEPRFLKENVLNSSTQAVKGIAKPDRPFREYRLGYDRRFFLGADRLDLFCIRGRVIINNDKATPGREKLPALIRASARENWIRHDRVKYAQITAPFEPGTGGAGNKGFPDVAGKTGTGQLAGKSQRAKGGQFPGKTQGAQGGQLARQDYRITFSVSASNKETFSKSSCTVSCSPKWNKCSP